MSLALDNPGNATGFLARLRKNFFATKFDGVMSVAFGALIVWLLMSIADWAIFDAIFRLENRDQCTYDAGACWAVIESRGRLIMFGLYPYAEQWRSTLACLVIIVTMVLSCVPLFWSIRRLPMLWVGGFATFVLLMRGGFWNMPLVTSEQWGGLALTLFIFSAVFVIGMPLAVLFALARRSDLPVIAKAFGLLIDFVRSLPLLTILFAAAVVVPLIAPEALQGNKLMRVVVAFAVFFARASNFYSNITRLNPTIMKTIAPTANPINIQTSVSFSDSVPLVLSPLNHVRNKTIFNETIYSSCVNHKNDRQDI